MLQTWVSSSSTYEEEFEEEKEEGKGKGFHIQFLIRSFGFWFIGRTSRRKSGGDFDRAWPVVRVVDFECMSCSGGDTHGLRIRGGHRHDFTFEREYVPTGGSPNQ